MDRITLVAVLVLLVSGCAPTKEVDLSPSQYMAIMKPNPLPVSPREMLYDIGIDQAYPRPGYTYAIWAANDQGAVDVFYASVTGDAFFWYPGDEQVVFGEYRLSGKAPEGALPHRRNVDGLKFKYQSNSYNPATGKGGGSWEKLDRKREIYRVISYIKGDVFNLASGEVPYKRVKCDLPAPMEVRLNLQSLYCETPGVDRTIPSTPPVAPQRVKPNSSEIQI